MIAFGRIIVPFLAPLPLGLLFVFFALLCLLLRLRKTAACSLVFALSIFLFFGYGLSTRRQLRELERQYPPLDLSKMPEQERQQIKLVVVLGNTHATDPAVPATGQLSAASLYRLAEGIRLHRQLPDSWMVFTGGPSPGDPQTNAAVVGRAAQLLGVDGGKIVIEDRPRDTFEEAELLQPLLKNAPFILVTSAAHVVRAMKLFQHAGMQPIAAPTDFILKDNPRLTSESMLPSCGNLEISERVIYEKLGNLWNFVQQATGGRHKEANIHPAR